jgi:hypothetical protein
VLIRHGIEEVQRAHILVQPCLLNQCQDRCKQGLFGWRNYSAENSIMQCRGNMHNFFRDVRSHGTRRRSNFVTLLALYRKATLVEVAAAREVHLKQLRVADPSHGLHGVRLHLFQSLFECLLNALMTRASCLALLHSQSLTFLADAFVERTKWQGE